MDQSIVDTRDKKTNEATVEEATKRYRDAMAHEQSNHAEARDDLNMLAGKNHWPAQLVRERENADRPVLTINKLPTFVDQVIGDGRLNKISIKVLPHGGGATKELAETFNGLIRDIENESDADVAYQTGMKGAANNGFGFFRVISDYLDDSTFEQELRIKAIRNPLKVVLDPAHEEQDGRDIRYAFITEMVSREEYAIRYPGKTLTPFKDIAQGSDIGLWAEEERVRIAEYWVKRPKTKRLLLLSDKRTVDADEWESIVDDLKAQETMIHLEPNPQDPNGPPIEVPGPAPEGSGFPETVLNPTPTVIREREVKSHVVLQYLIDGEQVIEGPNEWAGKYIPIIPVWGKETVIDEERYLRGVIRFAKDPQRMYNYFRSSATETVGLAPKSPWVLEERQIEGHEDEWRGANINNPPVLLYRGQPGIPPPQRQIVTQTAIGEITESNLANDEMKATTGIYDPSLGAKSNETSGRAILARQREGDVANFEYHDNLKRAIRYCGDILVDLIPRIYDTTRQVTIRNDKDEEEMIMINQVERDAATGQDVIINDLSQGRYKVEVITGPSFTTARVEAAESMLDFIRVAPEAATAMIDLVAENMDWPGSAKIAERMKKLVPQELLEGEDGQPQGPRQPKPEEVQAALKMEGMTLGNEKKRLDILAQSEELNETVAGAVDAAVVATLRTLGIIGGENEQG